MALVGESGSGKSSIIQLACRFYDPSEGAVRLFGSFMQETAQVSQAPPMDTAV